MDAWYIVRNARIAFGAVAFFDNARVQKWNWRAYLHRVQVRRIILLVRLWICQLVYLCEGTCDSLLTKVFLFWRRLALRPVRRNPLCVIRWMGEVIDHGCATIVRVLDETDSSDDVLELGIAKGCQNQQRFHTNDVVGSCWNRPFLARINRDFLLNESLTVPEAEQKCKSNPKHQFAKTSIVIGRATALKESNTQCDICHSMRYPPYIASSFEIL